MKSILIILTLGMVVVNIILDVTILKDVFVEQNSSIIPVLSFNIGSTLGLPKLIHFLYKDAD